MDEVDLSDMPDDPDPFIAIQCSMLSLQLSTHDFCNTAMDAARGLERLKAAWQEEVPE